MKQLRFTPRLAIFIFVCVATSLHVVAQQTHDVVTMLNGDTKQGKVTAVSEQSVKFKYANEDLEYELKKADILRIQFASGRTETFNDAPPAASAAPATTAEERKNKIAVLPFNYITNDGAVNPDQMANRVQIDCVNSLRKNTRGLNVQDPATTNALLAQHHVDPKNMAAILPKDVAVMLGVQYVVIADVNVMTKGSHTSGTGVTTYKDKDNQNRDGNNKSTKSSGTAVTGTSTTTQVQYDTTLDFAIYDDQGATVYTQSRKAFGDYADAYTSPLDYLIKRTPFGTKAK